MKELSDIAAINEAMQIEMAQPTPNEAVLQSLALFKANAERRPDVTAPPEGLRDDQLPRWIK